MEYAIAVIDIGMTNKKVAVYDDTLRQLVAQNRVFDPLMVEGLECHDLAAMEDWFLEELGRAGKQFPVRAIAVSAHGANCVCIGADGKPALPCVYYTHEPGADFHRRFYERFGPAVELQERTGTPAFAALLNFSKGIRFAQERFPEAFKNVQTILPFAQYWGFRLTGKAAVESTYMCCHSYIWDQVDHCLSSVARDLGVAALFPDKLNQSWDVLGTVNEDAVRKTGLAPEVIVTMGMHDSNASLLPHFAKRGMGGFVVNSTGTWCVMMNPVKRYGFAPDELGKVVFFNVSAFGTPIKTAIFQGGQEFETWSKILMVRHKRDDFPPYDEGPYRAILREADCFLLPELTAGSGQFPGSKPRIVEGGKTWAYEDIAAGGPLPPCFNDYERGFAVLRLSLVMQSLTALERTGLEGGTDIFTEGGFRKNEAYNRILSSAFKNNRVYLTGIAEATALGAALSAKMALTGKEIAGLSGDFTVDYQEVPKSDIPEIFSYRKAWTREVEKR
jgi:sugar (pentulose or hexulose) kinase